MRNRLLAGLASLVIIVGGGLHLTTTNAAAAESTRACTVLDQVRLTSAVADICGGCAECTFDGDCNGTCTCC